MADPAAIDERGRRLYLRASMDEPERLRLPGGDAVVFARGAPHRDGPNEDAAAVLWSPDGAVLAVADGMGGAPSGEEASGDLLECLAGELEGGAPDRALRVRILDGIEGANDHILEGGAGSKTTLALVTVEDGAVRPYHVGDSELLVVGQRGRVKLKVVAHSPVAYAVEAGVLDPAAALHHEDRHFVTNVVGSVDMRIEVGAPLSLAARDTVLLATDGLFDNLTVDEIVELIRVGPIERAARRLVEEARRRMVAPMEGEPCKPDDLAFVLFRPARAPVA